jgi:hypothetical protein
MGFAFMYSQSQPTADEIYQSLPNPDIGARSRLMSWFIIKKAKSCRPGGMLSLGRWSMTLDAWKDFLVELPFPCAQSDPYRDVDEVFKNLGDVLGLIQVDNKNILVTMVTQSLSQVSQEDPEILSIVFGCCQRGLSLGVLKHTFCPLLSSTLYWLSQRRRLPRIIMPKNGIEGLIPSMRYSPLPMKMDLMYQLVNEIVSGMARGDGVLSRMHGWQVQNLIAIIMMTCYLLVGFSPKWQKQVPRSPYCLHVSDMSIFLSVVEDALVFLHCSPDIYTVHIGLHRDLIKQANTILDNSQKDDFDLIELENNPLSRYVLDKVRLLNPGINEVVEALIDICTLTEEQKSWLKRRDSQVILFQGDWLAATLHLSTDSPGEFDLNPVFLDRD